ncbi:hypothetical protein BJ508DRAFT_323274 [Ascobolus immersus RN42]|uniref:Uncharacterized protein n=1 Tax=Ascobolus immersus RN42 TaxID=1160509 RepID=A0A3N4IEY1_ASCIM|nr:hypothetical protein BJ508DRAFT_323274 [Ascobolus immersus RN42]
MAALVRASMDIKRSMDVKNTAMVKTSTTMVKTSTAVVKTSEMKAPAENAKDQKKAVVRLAVWKEGSELLARDQAKDLESSLVEFYKAAKQEGKMEWSVKPDRKFRFGIRVRLEVKFKVILSPNDTRTEDQLIESLCNALFTPSSPLGIHNVSQMSSIYYSPICSGTLTSADKTFAIRTALLTIQHSKNCEMIRRTSSMQSEPFLTRNSSKWYHWAAKGCVFSIDLLLLLKDKGLLDKIPSEETTQLGRIARNVVAPVVGDATASPVVGAAIFLLKTAADYEHTPAIREAAAEEVTKLSSANLKNELEMASRPFFEGCKRAQECIITISESKSSEPSPALLHKLLTLTETVVTNTPPLYNVLLKLSDRAFSTVLPWYGTTLFTSLSTVFATSLLALAPPATFALAAAGALASLGAGVSGRKAETDWEKRKAVAETVLGVGLDCWNICLFLKLVLQSGMKGRKVRFGENDERWLDFRIHVRDHFGVGVEEWKEKGFTGKWVAREWEKVREGLGRLEELGRE